MRRLLLAIPTVFAASVVLFLLLMVGPNPLASLAQEGDVDVTALAHQNGWDRPWAVQYVDWLGNLLHGDWGTSVRTSESARDMILHRVPLTLGLGLCSTLIALLVALPLAMWAARRRNEPGDRWLTGAMVAFGALPTFMIALLLQGLAVKLRDWLGVTVFYAGGMPREGGAVEFVQRFALPVTVLAMVQLAGWMRFQRAGLITSLDSDAVLAARGRGLPRTVLHWRHALLPTLGPIVTLVALELGTLIGGTIVVETVFNLPGIGRLLLDSLQARDVVVALDIVMLGSVAIVIATVAADLLVARLDPRAALD